MNFIMAMPMLKVVAVLFAGKKSIYKNMPQCDVWDIDRDALGYSGNLPVVAHPPCRAWGGLSHMAKPRPGEKDLAIWAVDQVRRIGGVLEHPRKSKLWSHLGLPSPFDDPDVFGGWTLGAHQNEWGHWAEKSTLLYICGIHRRDIPIIPLDLSYAQYVISTSKKGVKRPRAPSSMCEATPVLFAEWLVKLAQSCHVTK